MLIRHVDLKGALVDVRISEGIVREIGLNLEHDDEVIFEGEGGTLLPCLLYTSPSPRDGLLSRMPSSA